MPVMASPSAQPECPVVRVLRKAIDDCDAYPERIPKENRVAYIYKCMTDAEENAPNSHEANMFARVNWQLGRLFK